MGAQPERRILHVEPSLEVRRAIRRLTPACGFRTDSAASVAEAHALAKKFQYAAIIANVSLQDADGLQFLEEISGDQPDADLFLTTPDYTDNAVVMLSDCMIYVLPKPEICAQVFETLLGSGPE